MLGSYKINLLFGLGGFLLVSMISFHPAMLVDSLIKSLSAFVLFYLFAYFIRWLSYLIATDQHSPADEMFANKEDEGNAGNIAYEQKENKQLDEEEIKKAALLVKDLLKEN